MQTAKILIIDDEEEICKVSKSVLEKTERFEVVFSTKAKNTLELAKSYKPDLILLDILMPDMDGTDIAEQLSSDPLTKGIPLVFLTAMVKESEVKESSGIIGSRLFISKPVGPQELINRVESILNSKR